ncbi:ATP-dependent helicase, partial [Streptomyces sp. NPDC006551]
ARLMTDAGISPRVTQVRSGEAELNRITGAQAPSGIPVVITAPVAERPKRDAGARSRRNRPSQAMRRAAQRRTAYDPAA